MPLFVFAISLTCFQALTADVEKMYFDNLLSAKNDRQFMAFSLIFHSYNLF